ncbi:CBN-FMO-2 protein [Aphelenchoides avenae]|nr:CBN-FMO-2 protein [Aphelenchus avenae]
MKTTTLNTSKEVTAFSDFPAPADFPHYMRNDQFFEYLRLYALHHDLYRNVRLRHTVLQVKRATDYCESHNSVPNFPNGGEEWWPNQSRFEGRIMHSKEYKHGGGFEDQICVVVGSGNSAVDVASDLSRVAKKVHLSLRKGAYIIGRLGDRGRPIDLNLLTRFRTYFINRYTPKWLLSRQMKRLLQRRFDHALYGLMPEDSVLTSQVSLSDDLPSRIMTGTVVVKPAIKEFTSTGIVWSDGTTTEHVDAVICATGYEMSFKMVEEGSRVPVEGNFARLYKNIFPVDDACLRHNTLGFVGLAQVFGSSIALSEMQARYFFHQLCSRTKERPRGLLPFEKEMSDEVEARRHKLGGKVDRKPLWVDYIPYMDSLADAIGCRPNLFELAFKDPMLAWAVTFGPNSTYAYRLHGTCSPAVYDENK